MSDTTKERVLAKCQDLAPSDSDNTRLGDGYAVVSNYDGAWTLRSKSGNVKAVVAPTFPDDDEAWPLAAKILGIEDEQAKADRGIPTIDEIHFVAIDESHSDRHGWQSLNQKPAYVDGFDDGAKWAIKRLCGMEVEWVT